MSTRSARRCITCSRAGRRTTRKNADEMMQAAVAGAADAARASSSTGVPPELVDDRRQGARARPGARATRTRARSPRISSGSSPASSSRRTTTRRASSSCGSSASTARSSASRSRGDRAARASATVVIVQRIRRRARPRRRAAHASRSREKQSPRPAARSRDRARRASSCSPNARHAASTDPTRAVAMVKPLVDASTGARRAIVGAAARVHGVAWSLPASPHTSRSSCRRDGERALAAGDDGVVPDLRSREARRRAIDRRHEGRRAGAIRRRRAQDRAVSGNRLTIVDAATGDKRDVTRADRDRAARGRRDRSRTGSSRQSAVEARPRRHERRTRSTLDEPVERSRRRPMVAGSRSPAESTCCSCDRTSPTLPPRSSSTVHTKAHDWSADCACT